MKIVLIKGPAGAGKTTLINNIYKELAQDISNEDIIVPWDNSVWINNDFQAVIRKNDKTIGFYSMGDIAHWVKVEIYRSAVHHKCDILIIASRNFVEVDRFIEDCGEDCVVINLTHEGVSLFENPSELEKYIKLLKSLI